MSGWRTNKEHTTHTTESQAREHRPVKRNRPLSTTVIMTGDSDDDDEETMTLREE